MATPHHTSTLPNSPNYYWEQALTCLDQGNILQCDMYLILYVMATQGE